MSLQTPRIQVIKFYQSILFYFINTRQLNSSLVLHTHVQNTFYTYNYLSPFRTEVYIYLHANRIDHSFDLLMSNYLRWWVGRRGFTDPYPLSYFPFILFPPTTYMDRWTTGSVSQRVLDANKQFRSKSAIHTLNHRPVNWLPL